jgi:hypothetical protein
VWAGTVDSPGIVVGLDATSGEVLHSHPAPGIVEEPLVTDEFVWVARHVVPAGTVVDQLDPTDASLIRDVPLGVSDPEGMAVELLDAGDGVWVVVVPATAVPVVVRIDISGEIATRTELSSATPNLEPVTDGANLFVGTPAGVVRIDRTGAVVVHDVPAPAEAGGLVYTAGGRLFVVRNDALYETDAESMTHTGSIRYEEQGATVPLLSGAGGGRLQVEEVYPTADGLAFLASGGDQPGTTFFVVDADGVVVVRTAVIGGLVAGSYDLRRTGPEQFWAYAQTSPPVLLGITLDGVIEEALEFGARYDQDADLTVSGGLVVVSDATPDGRPVIHLVDPDGPELVATIDRFT